MVDQVRHATIRDVIPLRATIRSSTVPFVNHTLIALNVAVFFYQQSLGLDVEEFVPTHGRVGLSPVLVRVSAALGVGSLGSTSAGSVAFWAHIGGFVAGMVLGPLFAPCRTPRPAW